MRRGALLALLAIPALAARAQADWKHEFEQVCAGTQDAMSLGLDELHSLIGRCDMLKPQIEALGPSEKKVYAKRLQACRDLYAFVLRSREQG